MTCDFKRNWMLAIENGEESKCSQPFFCVLTEYIEVLFPEWYVEGLEYAVIAWTRAMDLVIIS